MTVSFESPDDLSTRYRLAKAYADLGNTLYSQNQYERAKQHYQQALDQAPDLPIGEISKLNCNIGLCLASQNQLEEARRYFSIARELSPDDPLVQFHLDRLIYEEQNRLRGYTFWQDSFSRNMPVLRDTLQRFVDQPQVQGLVVGGWDGRSLCWLLEHIFTHASAHLTCIARYELHPSDRLPINADQPPAVETLEPLFRENLSKTGAAQRVQVLSEPPVQGLRSLPCQTWDLVYLDESQRAQGMLTDAVLSWELLKPGGLMILDYYDIDETHPAFNTKLGIDAFLLSFAPSLTLLHRSHLVVVEKGMA